MYITFLYMFICWKPQKVLRNAKKNYQKFFKLKLLNCWTSKLLSFLASFITLKKRLYGIIHTLNLSWLIIHTSQQMPRVTYFCLPLHCKTNWRNGWRGKPIQALSIFPAALRSTCQIVIIKDIIPSPKLTCLRIGKYQWKKGQQLFLMDVWRRVLNSVLFLISKERIFCVYF